MKILVVDDDVAIAESLAEALGSEKNPCDVTNDGKAALARLLTGGYDIAIIDLVMPEKNGIEVLVEARKAGVETEFVMVTGFGSIETAIDAMKLGASDYLTKPVNLEELRCIVNKLAASTTLRKENARLRRLVLPDYPVHEIIGLSTAMQKIRETVFQVAPRKVTVMIEGESGTGKEVVANALARLSGRTEKPFLRMNCGALSQGILESELFGHEKGSFTGAVGQKKGIFEAAHGGTLFLDEIGEMPLESQVRLLRVLESGEFTRVGGVQPITVDVRIIAATNKDLKKLVEEGRFREDLFYRLNVVRITLPPLRERREDIPLLMQHFLGLYNAQNGTDFLGFDQEVVSILVRLDWPGNVRELRNVVERLLVFSTGEVVTLADLPDDIVQREITMIGENETGTMAEIEKKVINRTLQQTGNNVRKAARILDIPVRTLYRRIKSLDEPE